ncbi:hypothetical protein [Cupriavidus sp. D39]|uniref:hypothetical protein n=1 Tax=Cupriavidus sp. D39 TaxID=2997877 RepID=UPI002D1E42E9|nr:hypothetical protein [Cupriavidus sp. D39]
MRICQIDLSPTQLDGAPVADALARAAALGFDHVLLAGWPVLHAQGAALAQAVAACGAHGLSCLLELALDRYPEGSAGLDPGWREPAGLAADLRDTDNHLPGVRLRWHDPHTASALVPWWEDRLRTPVAAGIAGFVCRAPARVAGRHWAALIAGARRAAPGRSVAFLAWTPGLGPTQLDDLREGGFDGAFCSLPWWDYRSAWLTEEIARLRPLARCWLRRRWTAQAPTCWPRAARYGPRPPSATACWCRPASRPAATARARRPTTCPMR